MNIILIDLQSDLKFFIDNRYYYHSSVSLFFTTFQSKRKFEVIIFLLVFLKLYLAKSYFILLHLNHVLQLS